MTLALTSCMSEVADEWVAAVATHIGVEFVGGQGDERLEGLRRTDIAAGWVCGLLHATERRSGAWELEPVAAPVMAAARYEDRPVYFGDVVVAAGSAVATLDDLAGSRLAINEETSLSGHDMLVHRLGGLDRFGEVVRSGSHLRSLELVTNGLADAACIDSTVMDMGAAQSLEAVSGVRVVEALGPYPAPPIVVSRLVDTASRENLTARLVGLADADDGAELLSSWGVARFARVDESSYASL